MRNAKNHYVYRNELPQKFNNQTALKEVIFLRRRQAFITIMKVLDFCTYKKYTHCTQLRPNCLTVSTVNSHDVHLPTNTYTHMVTLTDYKLTITLLQFLCTFLLLVGLRLELQIKTALIFPDETKSQNLAPSQCLKWFKCKQNFIRHLWLSPSFKSRPCAQVS
jgi:hypothetical protein